MLTHNINAESGANPPMYGQCYEPALKAGIKKTKGFRMAPIPLSKSGANQKAGDETAVILKQQELDEMFKAR